MVVHVLRSVALYLEHHDEAQTVLSQRAIFVAIQLCVCFFLTSDQLSVQTA